MGKFLLTLLVFSLLLFRIIHVGAPLVGAQNSAEAPESLADLQARDAAEEMEGITTTTEFQAFKTVYTTIFYTHEEDLELFLWNITGDKEINIYSYPGLAKNRVDRIVEKIQSILDMYPERFRINVYVHRQYDRGPIAFYSYGTRAITVYADRITERVFAHELAHAIIRAYFKVLPPKKIREMLAQYVDHHLWEE